LLADVNSVGVAENPLELLAAIPTTMAATTTSGEVTTLSTMSINSAVFNLLRCFSSLVPDTLVSLDRDRCLEALPVRASANDGVEEVGFSGWETPLLACLVLVVFPDIVSIVLSPWRMARVAPPVAISTPVLAARFIVLLLDICPLAIWRVEAMGFLATVRAA